MKTRSRNLLTAILVLLSVITVALGISFMLSKEIKSANAATSVPAFVPGAVSSGYSTSVYSDGKTMSGTAVTEQKTTALTSGYFRFSIQISVPAYTEYTLTYKMALCISASYSGSGSVGGRGTVERYADGTYSSPIGTHCTREYTLTQTTNYDVTYFEVANLVFANDTNSSKTFTTYFNLNVESIYKTVSASMYFGMGFSPNTSIIEVTKLAAPETQDDLVVDYDGNAHTVNFEYAKAGNPKHDLDGNAVAYNNGYKNINVSVSAVGGNGATTNAYTYTPSTTDGSGSITATQAGTYKLTFSISNSAKSNGIEWDGGGQGNKELILKINKIDPTVNPDIAEGPWYVTNNLVTDVTISTTSGDTAGTIVWDAGQTLSAGTNNYSWTFTPTDTNNYNTKTGTVSITVESITISSIKAMFNQGSAKYYTSGTLDDLKARLAVDKVYNDNSTSRLNAGDYSLSGDISTAGTVTVTVTYTSTPQEDPAVTDRYRQELRVLRPRG